MSLSERSFRHSNNCLNRGVPAIVQFFEKSTNGPMFMGSNLLFRSRLQ